MMYGVPSSLSNVIAPGKSRKPSILILDGVDLIIIILAQTLKKEPRLTFTILIHMIEDGRCTLSTSGTFRLSDDGIKTAFLIQLCVSIKGKICVLCVLRPEHRLTIEENQGYLVDILLVWLGNLPAFSPSEEITLLVKYGFILAIHDLV